MYIGFDFQGVVMANLQFFHTFPAVRGMQAGRPCYVAMCPMRIVPKLFLFDEDEVPPELRAQRTLNTARIPQISEYLTQNPNNYTLSSITASIGEGVGFEPSADTGLGQNIGVLSIPMDAQILINDGQHRRAAIEMAIKENPELAHDNISVVFFIDEGLVRSQQMFADLNTHSVRPSDSISTLYDHRDPISELARYTKDHVHVFAAMTETEKSSISNRSSKLFTLSAIKNATRAFLSKTGKAPEISIEEKEIAAQFWNDVAANMPDWQMALQKKISTWELRENYIHAHAVFLQAMGQIGADIVRLPKNKRKEALSVLSEIDWSRTGSEWQGRAMILGRISKARSHVLLTGNKIKQKIGLELSPSENEAEQEYLQSVQ
jgi:DNA sulfur modification protein DndB